MLFHFVHRLFTLILQIVLALSLFYTFVALKFDWISLAMITGYKIISAIQRVVVIYVQRVDLIKHSVSLYVPNFEPYF